jgi:hypothetical protein
VGCEQMQVSRHWKGITRPGQADAYIHHLRTETFPQLAAIPGFVRASILTRDSNAGTEFQVVTVWESLEAIQAFAGAGVTDAVVPPFVQGLMARYDRHAVHFEITGTFEPGGGREAAGGTRGREGA